jgi:hypothetical protein
VQGDYGLVADHVECPTCPTIPQIQASEMPKISGSGQRPSLGGSLRLVPSAPGKTTTVVTSGASRVGKAGTASIAGNSTIGSTEHGSALSVVVLDEPEGVMRELDFQVVSEEKKGSRNA